MFLHFLAFEVKYRLARVSTYVYFAIWFFMTFFAVAATNFGPVGTGKVYLNGPFAISMYCVQLSMFGTFVISALFGTAALRDFQENTYALIFTKPLSKFAYLGGRWAGSFLVSVAVFSSILLGTFCGSLMPWVASDRIAPFRVWNYLQPFLSVTVVQIFFLGSLFFAVAALTRRLMIVYLQGVILFAVYLIGMIYVMNSQSLERFWPSVFDPMGLIVFQTATRYWSVAERNTQLLGWDGAFLYNRLLWTGLGFIALAATLVFFPMSAEVLTSRGTARRAAAQRLDDEETAIHAPAHIERREVNQLFGRAALWSQLSSLTRLRFLNIVREIPFWAIVLLTICMAVINGRQAGHLFGTPVWPVTYLMVMVLQGGTIIFFFTIATLYTGEVVWRERDVRFDQIHDALPIATWADWVTRLAAIFMVEVLLLIVIMVCGIGAQTSLGYYHYEIPVYLKELFLIALPSLVTFILLCFLSQTVLNNKYLGHAMVIGTFLLMPILYRYGIENRLLLIGETAPYTYSDMNGYGHFVPAVTASTLYWLAFAILCGVVSIALARRGTDLAWRNRRKEAITRGRGLSPAVIAALLLFTASGAWFYYNTHVINRFRTSREFRRERADYERAFKQYQRLAQPKITAVEANVDIYPERRSLVASGHYDLVNRYAQPISEVHIRSDRELLRDLRFDRGSRVKFQDTRLGYWIHQLNEPLAPGTTMRLDFKVGYDAKGFRDGQERNDLAYNGTFFSNAYFPAIGYERNAELDDPTRRREENLAPQEEMPTRGDPYYSNLNLFTPTSEWITYKTVVSTSPDQIAIAPGYLKREWSENGRRYFEYDMGDTRINHFFSYVSGRYAVKRDAHKDVKLEIYYHAGHEYNLQRMLQSCKRGLDYFETSFSPYQFRQFRIIEFPRYRTFAQSFPNTIPYSEALGFIQRVEKPDDIDMIFYVTAHELAHQWWGHQLIGSMTQGSNMMSETLAQYSALMIMEKEYGQDQIRKFLKHELDSYLRGRGAEKRKEPPLVLVQREGYVWYNKGSLAMYALRDYIGEDRLNAALRKFLMENRYSKGPFPDTRGFVAALRVATPPELQNVITDLFEEITLFDNKATAATWTQLPDKRYKVALTVESRKLKADGAGTETEVPINDLVDIGVFIGAKDKEKPLYLAKHKLTEKQTKLEFVVDQQPTRVGIDPYHKLIDRKPDDNMMNISKM